MKIYKTRKVIIIHHQDNYFLSGETNWDNFLNRPALHNKILNELKVLRADNSLVDALNVIEAPIGRQEVWASGVTYLRSREARMEEAKDAGGGDFYARVYEAERPELFFKAPAHRTVGPGEKVRIRKESKWNVPEQERT